MNLSCPVERGLNIGHDVFATHAVKKARALQQFGGLLHCAAEQQRSAGFMQSFCKSLDSVNAGGVDGRHVAQAQNDHRCKCFEVDGRFDQLLCGAEKKRPVNAKQRHVRRKDAALQHVGQAVADVFVSHRRDGGGFSDAIDIEQRGQGKADPDGDRQIRKDRERKGDQPDARWRRESI